MSFQFMPLYTGDYLRDTAHLSPMKHGVYLLLLMYCWNQKGPLPLDEQECSGVANCRSADEIEALRYVLNRFFVRMEDGWYNHRMQREVERASAISNKRKSAGRKGFQAKAKHLLSKSSASATTPTPTPTTTTTPTTTSASPVGETVAPSPFGLEAPVQQQLVEDEVIVAIPLNNGSEFAVTKDFRDELDKLYPAVDPDQTLREIRGWSLGNPTKRKTQRGVRAFITSWFAREQDKQSRRP